MNITKQFSPSVNNNDKFQYETFHDDEKFHDACGVFGIYLNDCDKDAAPLIYYGLLSLQHRGQECAGMAAVKDGTMECRKGLGLVSEVFTPQVIDQIKGPAAVGHVLYSTAGTNIIENAEPFVSRFKLGSVAVAHNGSLTNADVVRELLEDAGVGFASTNDGEVIVNLISRNYKKGLERALIDTIQSIKGSYALAVLTESALVGARDPNGIRPLCLGQLDGGWILASESCAFGAVGGKFVRDIEPGEVVIINRDGVKSFSLGEKIRRAVCTFEYVYFARADSIIDNVDVYGARIRAGEILARESGVEADLVIGIPDSGVPAAIGYGRAANIPFGLGIVKSKYIARTFIAPGQIQREKAVSVKHSVITSEVRGKRVVIIDDSIVRGTTMKRLVEIIRAADAKEVHIRIVSPPVLCPCYFGVDTPHRKDLISNGNSVPDLCKSLGADSLAFISVDGLLESLAPSGSSKTHGYCLGCFSGVYPIPVPQKFNG
ncbi:MAG: amidophosphoribosyltransferase [Treponema sp.]|nr:amidophosphoribosyltransferase [Treponema sp.]